jgi:hypothetical protein
MSSYIPSVLIIDEIGFARVCSAFIEAEGFHARTHAEAVGDFQAPPHGVFCLVITSFNHAVAFSAEIKKLGLPTIVLADHLSHSLITLLEDFDNSYGMIKPLDYRKFIALVRQIIHGEKACCGGYSIV